jgi:pimeloyl-ACP methyl ester carboxylesterase
MRIISFALAMGLSGCAGAGGASMKMSSEEQGAGDPVVLIGGGLTGWRSWERHQAALAPTRRAVRLQLLSVEYGLDNRPLPLGYSVKMESQALAAALDERGLRAPVDLVAWSYGAVVTLDFALDHPERVRTLTLIEPPAFWVLRATGEMDPQSRSEIEALQTLHEGMRDDVSEEQLGQFLRQVGLCPPGQRPQQLPQWPVAFQHRRSLRNGDAVFGHVDRAERLRAFSQPVLLWKGTGSSHFLHRIVDVLAETMSRAQVAELPGGHAPHLAAPDRFLERLAAFQRSRG